MGAGGFDVVMGFDAAVLNTGLDAVWTVQALLWSREGSPIPNPQFSATDAAGDNWNFAVTLGAPMVAVRPGGVGSVPLTLSMPLQVAATDATNPANGFTTAATLTVPGFGEFVFDNTANALNPVTLSFFLMSGEAAIAVAGDTAKSQLLTQGLAFQLAVYIAPFLPSLGFPAPGEIGVVGSLPVTVATDTSLSGATLILLFANIAGGPVTAPDAGTSHWPGGGIFLACDPDLSALPPLAMDKQGDGRKGDTTYWYDASVLIGFKLVLLGGGSISAPIDASGPCDFTIHTPEPFENVSFDGSFSASGQVQGTLAATPNPAGSFNISLRLTGVGLSVSIVADVPSVIPGLPGFNLPVGDIGNLVSSQISGAVTDAVNGNDYMLAAINPSFSNSMHTLSLSNPAITQISGPGGTALLGITATPVWTAPH